MSDDSKLSASKQALLANWLQGKVKTQSSIPRRPADAQQAALSFAQQRLWFLDQYSQAVRSTTCRWPCALPGLSLPTRCTAR
jgi:hypothetical protein